MPENHIECKSFTVIRIDSLLVHKKYYLQLYLDDFPNKQMADDLDENLSEYQIL